jgi:hypothetical protein
MKLYLKNVLGALAITFLIVSFAAAQEDTSPKQKLRSGVWFKGEVGGEAHQGYVIRARKGQTITVEISRRVPTGGNFNLTVSRSANFFNAEGVKFGKETSSKRRLVWTGKARASGNYYFYLTGHNPNDPSIGYAMRVTVK